MGNIPDTLNITEQLPCLCQSPSNLPSTLNITQHNNHQPHVRPQDDTPAALYITQCNITILMPGPKANVCIWYRCLFIYLFICLLIFVVCLFPKLEEKRHLVKSSFLVELVSGWRKLRYIFLFSDILVCTKREQHR